MAEDDRLLAELGEAVRAAQQVPPGFVEAGKAAFAWRDVDAELAALTRDSTRGAASGAAAAAGTRADPAGPRGLTFAAGDLSIEVEVSADAVRGQVVPPQPGQVELQHREGSGGATPVDEVGWFEIRPTPAGAFRLHLRTAAGVSVVTEWVTR